MSELKLRIDKYLDTTDDVGAPRIVARISGIDPSGRSNASTSIRRELIPISHDPKVVKPVDLPEGTYYVEATLPSGETLASSVTLAKDEKRELTLRGRSSPNEWFSWQHLMGNTRPVSQASSEPVVITRAPARPGASGSGTGRGSMRRPPRTAKKKAAKRSAAPSGGARAIPPSPPRVERKTGPVASDAGAVLASAPWPTTGPRVDIGRPIKLLATPRAPLVAGDPGSAEVWQWLGEANSDGAESFVKQLNQGNSPADVPVYQHSLERAVYRMSWQNTGKGSVHPLQGHVPPASRYFAAVPRRRCVELLSLPMPWHVIDSGREAAVEIGVQQMHASDSFCATAGVRDETLGLLIGFLSSGAFSVAQEMTDAAKDMLFGKVQNPYAAAAGGYAMVATALNAQDPGWHVWIRNLSEWFPHVPDGAIQWAQLQLRMRRSQADIEEARKALKLAYRRGLPFYSMGVKWLMDGLEWIAKDDQEAAMMFRNVRRVAWITNFQQAFTILRVGNPGS